MDTTNKNSKNDITTKVIKPFSTSWSDYPDDESLALLVYFSGCEHNCTECHNLELQDSGVGIDIGYIELHNLILSEAKRHKVDKIVFTGGEPLHPNNIFITNALCESLSLDYDICIYTGYDIYYVMSNNVRGFKFIKCGKYNESKKVMSEKTDDYLQLASTNQVLYNSQLEMVSYGGRYYF